MFHSFSITARRGSMHAATRLGALALVAASLGSPATTAAQTTVNFSNLESVLSSGKDSNASMVALWAGFFTQVYEYSMPFVEVSVDLNDAPVTELRMTIGDAAFNFSDEFQNIQFTNSTASVQPGGYARLGQSSSPGVSFTSSVEDNGDTLVVDFGPGGLQPGEVARFQVDIDSDSSTGEMFPSYTSVLFDANASPPDSSDNTDITLTRDGALPLILTVPDFAIDDSTLPNQIRSYSVMQMIDPIEPQVLVVIPEPTSMLLAVLATSCLVGRRR